MMNSDVTRVSVQAVLPLEHSCAVFLGNESKCFVIYVQEQAGNAISMAQRGVPTDRPMTHELMARVLLAFGGKVERVVINDVEGPIFYARLILSAENELHAKKLVELDARPSDCMVLALQAGAPIFVSEKVWSTVDDFSHVLGEVKSGGLQSLKFNSFSGAAAQGMGAVAESGVKEDSDDEVDEDELDELLANLPDVEDDDDDDDDFDPGTLLDFLEEDDDEEGEEDKEDDDESPWNLK
jgi:uncharacterized protein